MVFFCKKKTNNWEKNILKPEPSPLANTCVLKKENPRNKNLKFSGFNCYRNLIYKKTLMNFTQLKNFKKISQNTILIFWESKALPKQISFFSVQLLIGQKIYKKKKPSGFWTIQRMNKQYCSGQKLIFPSSFFFLKLKFFLG
mmetsp:Transcript_48393/g.96847  ORF Transcript_48393/g.96847 Transcript_48393/m.96847 type:complete len:142 (+) Transcript_48393:566-991(+)